MKQLLLFLSIIATLELSAQADTLQTQNDSLVVRREHSVKKATIFSAVLPGLGQAYNRKYWKIPLVLGGIGTAIYFIDDNTRNYKFYRDNLIAELDDDPNTVNTSGQSSSLLAENMDIRRRNVDLSYIALAGVYVLNIIDANVDAHLFYFDVGDDLSVSFRPSLLPSNDVRTGLKVSLNF